MPIKGLSEQRRLPRLGKIHLGEKVEKKKEGGKTITYPRATPYFVCPPEVTAIYGDKPTKLDIIIPVDDEEIWSNQYYRQYSLSRGLVCKGDGATCRRMIDTSNGSLAGRDTKAITWREGCECPGRECPDYQSKACQEVMNLQFLLPKVPGIGVWQIDTGSIKSIMNINNCATMIRAMVPTGKVSWVPLTLSLEPMEVNNPEDGKKKTVHCMALRYQGSMADLIQISEKPRQEVLLLKPADDEAPDDRNLTMANAEKAEEFHAKVQDDIDNLWEGMPSGNQKKPDEKIVDGTAKITADKNTQEQKVSHTVDKVWLKESLAKVRWPEKTALSHIKNVIKYNSSKPEMKLPDVLDEMPAELCKKFTDKIQELLEAAGK